MVGGKCRREDLSLEGNVVGGKCRKGEISYRKIS